MPVETINGRSGTGDTRSSCCRGMSLTSYDFLRSRTTREEGFITSGAVFVGFGFSGDEGRANALSATAPNTRVGRSAFSSSTLPWGDGSKSCVLPFSVRSENWSKLGKRDDSSSFAAKLFPSSEANGSRCSTIRRGEGLGCADP